MVINMQCVNPFYLTKESIYVPCGKCLACRISRTREWTLRLLHENEHQIFSAFVTLTYAPEHLPENLSVSKRSLQLYIKRLRKAYEHPIKYFACGEYGEQSRRPHYHLIIFGIPYTSELFQNCWQYGHVKSGTVNKDSIQYVAAYVQKKAYGHTAQQYKELGLSPEFQLQSQGLGLSWATKHYIQLSTDRFCRLSGAKVSLPRYYRQKLDIDTTDLAIEGHQEVLERISLINSLKLDPTKIIHNYLLDRIFLNSILPAREFKLQHKYSLLSRDKITEVLL
ncbi:MAG: replication initiator protein [Microvirus sp.]|nr:MAG: replication initiator protein [Microvirus sp.]